MRLEVLEIGGFGRLAELEVRFHPRLTVVLGDNEAGKSTLNRAVRAALYGLDAGGQGRRVESSEWARWTPWSGGRYGLALAYELSDGTRVRVARRFEQRQDSVQVQILGGGDVTDDVRVGRRVAPGRFHLGVEEEVFRATAWLEEGGLRGDAPDGFARHAERLQEALERLADSGNGVSARDALALLQEARDRVGSERRSGSVLGRAGARLRELDAAMDDARRRAAAYGDEQDRLRRLEDAAGAAENERACRERAWLVGRLAALAAQRHELTAGAEELRRLESVAESTSACAAFPTAGEDGVIALGGELSQAMTTAEEARLRWEGARSRLDEVRRRREEIAGGLLALGEARPVARRIQTGVERLAREVGVEAGVRALAERLRAAEERCAGLRREAAATGLGGLAGRPPEEVRDLVGTATAGLEARRLVAALVVLSTVIGGAGGLLAALLHRPLLLLLALPAGGAAAATVAMAPRIRRGTPARRELARLCPGVVPDLAGLDRIAGGIEGLSAVRAELVRQTALADTLREEVDTAAGRLRHLERRAVRLAEEAEVPVPGDAVPAGRRGTPGGILDQTTATLSAVSDAAAAGRRRDELADADARLAAEEASLVDVGRQSVRAVARRDAIDGEIRRRLAEAGIEGETTAAAVARYRSSCQARRAHDDAATAAAAVRRRLSAVAADTDTIDRTIARLGDELRRRGGDPEAALSAAPIDGSGLQALEAAAEAARRAAEAARGEAGALRGRLQGLLESLPSLPDLEDEHATCSAVRERALHQLASLARASDLLEAASQRVHRAIAPRLARNVGDRLALLTEGRYAEVNVDPDHFDVSLHGPERPDLVPLDLVSRGTREQVSLLLRIALVEVLGQRGETAPLLLDEPLMAADQSRRRAAIDFLRALSATAQVVITTSDRALADEVAAAGEAHGSVFRLRSPATTARRARRAASLTG